MVDNVTTTWALSPLLDTAKRYYATIQAVSPIGGNGRLSIPSFFYTAGKYYWRGKLSLFLLTLCLELPGPVVASQPIIVTKPFSTSTVKVSILVYFTVKKLMVI